MIALASLQATTDFYCNARETAQALLDPTTAETVDRHLSEMLSDCGLDAALALAGNRQNTFAVTDAAEITGSPGGGKSTTLER